MTLYDAFSGARRLCCDHHGGWADAPSCEDDDQSCDNCGESVALCGGCVEDEDEQ